MAGMVEKAVVFFYMQMKALIRWWIIALFILIRQNMARRGVGAIVRVKMGMI